MTLLIITSIIIIATVVTIVIKNKKRKDKVDSGYIGSPIVGDQDNEELSISPERKVAVSEGETYTITVESDTNWTVSKNINWASISSTSGTGNGSINVTAGHNSTSLPRNGIITFSTSDVTIEHSIFQQK